MKPAGVGLPRVYIHMYESRGPTVGESEISKAANRMQEDFVLIINVLVIQINYILC